MRWYGIPTSLRIFQFVVIHTVKDFSIFNEAEVYVFLEFSCFFYDPMDFGSLISGIKIWKCIINNFTNLIHTHTHTHTHTYIYSYRKCEIKYLRKNI